MLPETLNPKTGCLLIPNSPQSTVKLSTAILAVIDQITLFAGAGRNDRGGGKAGTRDPDHADQSSWRILIIEDDSFSVELYTILLEASGYNTLPAADGEEGLALARRQKPDLIICDVILPKMGGCEIVRDLKADPVLRLIPIIAVTALGSLGDRERLLAAGFDGYIAKPIEAETFSSQIVSFLPEVH
ncbi:MAG: response regulator [Desulfobaccales bacterium]